ncbi:MAG: recombinase family protein [Candidatus Paceibacterota bacterium]|jgi:site-specific DNA recombinase
MEKNKLIAVYGRVSTSNQENEGTIETQLSAVNKFTMDNGFIIVKQYIDNGWSGDSLARPALDQLRMDAKNKNWESVLIYDPDRLARRGAWQEVVIEELKELEIDVLFVTIPKPKTDEDIIMYKMRGVFTEYERMKIKERFRLGKVRKANENNIILTEAPYGYNFIVKKGKRGDVDFKQGYLEINERESQIVKNIFSWVDEDGLRLRGIVRKLQKLGVPPRKSKRGVWNTSTLSTLLRNKTYIGEGHYGASYATVPVNPLKKETYKKIKKTSRRMKPESEWIKITTPKIIDEDLFYRVGEKLKSNFIMSERNTKNEYLLTGKIWCNCGKRRAGEGPQRGKHLYYRCTDRIKSFPLQPTCKEKAWNARIVDPLVWKKITEIMSSPQLLSKQVERWISNQNKGICTSTINTEETKKEIIKLEDQEDRYTKAYGAGVITIDQLKEYITPVKEKILSFNNQITNAQLESQQVDQKTFPEFSQLEIFAKKASEALNNLNFNAKKAIIRGIIDKVVGNKQELQVYGRIPIESNINVFSFNRDCGIT